MTKSKNSALEELVEQLKENIEFLDSVKSGIFIRIEQEIRESYTRFLKLAEDHELRLKQQEEKHRLELDRMNCDLNEMKCTYEKEKTANQVIPEEFNRLLEIILKLENEAKMNEIKATNLESEVARVKDPMIAGPNELFNRNVETFLASLKI